MSTAHGRSWPLIRDDIVLETAKRGRGVHGLGNISWLHAREWLIRGGGGASEGGFVLSTLLASWGNLLQARVHNRQKK